MSLQIHEYLIFIYKVQGRSSALPLHLGVVAIEKGAFGLPSTMVANFTYLYIKWIG